MPHQMTIWIMSAKLQKKTWNTGSIIVCWFLFMNICVVSVMASKAKFDW